MVGFKEGPGIGRVSKALMALVVAWSPWMSLDATAKSAAMFDMAKVEVVDLTHTYDDHTLYWPTSPSTFKLEKLHHGKTPAGFFYSANRFCTPEHGGTHIDAPIHFGAGGWTVDEVPLRRLMGPAVVIDVRQQAGRIADYRLRVEDIQQWEKRHAKIPSGAIVLMHSGWGKRWPQRKAYLGDDTPGDTSKLHFPAYGKEAAEYLVKKRGVAVLGLDTASIDYGPSKDFPVHRLAAAANVPGLENVANLEKVPAVGAWVIALPMKIAGGSGAPVRIVALVSPK